METYSIRLWRPTVLGCEDLQYWAVKTYSIGLGETYSIGLGETYSITLGETYSITLGETYSIRL